MCASCTCFVFFVLCFYILFLYLSFSRGLGPVYGQGDPTTDRETCKLTGRQTGRLAGKQTGRQTVKHARRQTVRLAERETARKAIETHLQEFCETP